VFRVLLMAGIAVCWLGNAARAQSAASAPFPPGNIELRVREHDVRLKQQAAERQRLQESRLRRLTGSGPAAGPAQAAVSSVGSVRAGRIAVQAAIGAVIGMAAISAANEDAGMLLSIQSGTATSAGSSSSTSTASSTSTSTATATQ
jgi:hypothetical protein